MSFTRFARTRSVRTAVALAVVALISSCSTPLAWQSYSQEVDLSTLTPAQWQEDLAFLRTELPARNPHFGEDPQMGQAFDTAAQAVLASIDSTTTAEKMVVELARLIALVGEGHTSLNALPDNYFPVIATWFADGFFVSGADREYASTIGARVVGIRDASGTALSTAELEPILNSVISADHPNGYRPSHAQVLSDPLLMRGLGLADETGLTYRLDHGSGIEEVTVAEKPGSQIEVVRATDDAPNTPLAARSGEPNWYTRTGLNDSVIYLRYDDCRMDAMGLFGEVLNELKRSSVERLIIDIRGNSGGISIPGSRFARQLSGIIGLDDPGDIFVLIGPGTFSSGMMFAVDLMDNTNAFFAGQPLAERPNSWGEVKQFQLPNSGLYVGHSTRFFRYGRGKDLRLDADGVLVPDEEFVIARTFEQYRLGIDPVVEQVLSYAR